MSNQSFDDATVGIVVTIDGTEVVDQDFDVEGQHNYFMFEPSVTAGKHTLEVTSSTGATLTEELTFREGQPQWAGISYWYAPGDDLDREFNLDISDEPMLFA